MQEKNSNPQQQLPEALQARIHELEAENEALRQEVLQLRKRLARTAKPGMATRLSEALRE